MFRRWSFVCCLPFVLTSPSAVAYEEDADTAMPLLCPSGLKEASVKVIMGYNGDPEKFSRLITAARKLNVSEQTLREARFFYSLENQDETGLAALADEFRTVRDHFNERDSELYSRKEDWLAVVAFVRAIKKRLAGDDAGFERGMKQAFWLSPRQASAFAPFVHKHQIRLALRRQKIKDDLSLTSVGGQKVSFEKWKKNHKGVIFHFVSLWNKQCAEVMPDFIETRKELCQQGFKVISVIVQPGESAQKELPEFLRRTRMPQEDLYYDLQEHSLAGRLCVEKLPAMALVNSRGKILFCGMPSEPEFWDKLRELDPDMKRPLLEPVRHSSSLYAPLD